MTIWVLILNVSFLLKNVLVTQRELQHGSNISHVLKIVAAQCQNKIIHTLRITHESPTGYGTKLKRKHLFMNFAILG